MAGRVSVRGRLLAVPLLNHLIMVQAAAQVLLAASKIGVGFLVQLRKLHHTRKEAVLQAGKPLHSEKGQRKALLPGAVMMSSKKLDCLMQELDALRNEIRRRK